MNLETPEVNKKPMKLNEIIDFDDIEIEDIPFKPINAGLGFHHGSKGNVTSTLKKSIHVDVTPTHSHISNFNKVLGREKEMSVPSELEAFYRKGTESEIPVVNREIEIKNKKSEASIIRRFCSYSIDMSISGLIFSVILTAMYYLSGMPLENFIAVTIKNSSYRYLITLFVLIHLIYRTTSVYRPTLGQHICGLKPKQSNEAAFNTIIEKTLFEFLSIPLLGIPYIFGLDKKFFGNSLKKTK